MQRITYDIELFANYTQQRFWKVFLMLYLNLL